MGLGPSKEEYAQERCNSLPAVAPIFPGHFSLEEKFVENLEAISELCGIMQSIVGLLTGQLGSEVASTVVSKCFDFMQSSYNLETAMLNLKIKKEVAQACATFVTTEIDAVSRQLKILEGNMRDDERTSHLVVADDLCYKILRKFMDDSFYLKTSPFSSSPMLVNFVAIYIPIATANYNLTSNEMKREELKRNMESLRSTVEEYRNKTLKDRLALVETSCTEAYWCLLDTFREDRRILHMDFATFRRPAVLREVESFYLARVTEVYRNYFTPALSCIEQFDANIN